MAIKRIQVLMLILLMIPKYSEQIKHLEKLNTNSTYQIRLISDKVKEIVNRIKFVKIDDFKQINYWNFDVSKYAYSETGLILEYLTNERVLLDSTFDVFYFQAFKTDTIYLTFFALNGFDVNEFAFYCLWSEKPHLQVKISNSNFDFYLNRKLIQSDECVAESFTKESYFVKVYSFELLYGTQYSLQTCNIVFKNAQIYSITFKELSDTFIRRNLLGFISQDNLTLNATIERAKFYFYQVKVDQKLVERQVFRHVKKFSFRGDITRIDVELFKHLPYIEFLELYVANLRKFFNNGIEWMNSINNFYDVNISNQTDIIENVQYLTIIRTVYQISDYSTSKKDEKNDISKNSYSYPDEDFCLFVNFPFNRMLFLDPFVDCDKNCTCTKYWLLQYTNYIHLSDKAYWIAKKYLTDGEDFYYNFMILDVIDQLSFLDEPDYYKIYDEKLKMCQFERRLNNCQTNNYQKKTTEEKTYFAAIYVSEMVDFAIVVLMPVVSVFGILIQTFNLITIAHIDLKKTPEDLQQKTLVRFMLAYSIINLVYCVIHLFSLISKCVELNGVYCSQLYFSQFAQYYKIICVEFVGGILKTCSNLAYLSISVNRFILLEKESLAARLIHRTLSTWTKKKKVISLMIISAVIIGLNYYKIVIYRVMDYYSITNLFYDAYPDLFFTLPFFLSNSKSYENSFNYESSGQVQTKSSVYEAFTYVNFVLNDIVLFVVFTTFDILLVISFKKSTDKKKIIMMSRLNDAKVQKQLSEMEKSVKKIMRVIIANICILLLVKVFDFFMSISKFRIWKQDLVNIDSNMILNEFCHTVKICSIYEEFGKILYMLYYCFSLVSFYNLNKNFRTNVKKSICCCKK